MKRVLAIILSLLLFSFILCACDETNRAETTETQITEEIESTIEESTYQETEIEEDTEVETQAPTKAVVKTFSISDVPKYSGEPYCIINDNIPEFKADEITTSAFENYGVLDSLGRCTTAFANVCTNIMPTHERGPIGSVKPTGWHTQKYDNIDGKYLYNRCHLIGYQLSGENANVRNLITGTRYLNISGMLPFENMVHDYVVETNYHVLYRVTPIFSGDNLVCDGVHMEGYSVEDKGDGVSFNIFAYNVQPGIKIDYKTGDSTQVGTTSNSENNNTKSLSYVVNKKTKKFHLPTCSSASSMSSKNRWDYTGKRADLINKGYTPCKICNP